VVSEKRGQCGHFRSWVERNKADRGIWGVEVIIAFHIFVALGALSALSILIFAIRRLPVLGIIAISTSLLTIWEVPSPAPLTTFAGLQIYANDLIIFVLLVVAFLNRATIASALSRTMFAWLALGALIAFSVSRGALEYGLGASYNEARSVIAAYATISWGLSVKWGDLNIRFVQLALGWILTALAVYHGALYGVGGASSFVSVGDGLQTGRLLVAAQALALALCATYLFLHDHGKTFTVRVSAIVFLSVAILSQHRSVWAALIAGIVLVAVAGPGASSKLKSWGLALGALCAGFVLVAVQALGDLWGELSESATNNGTFNARVESWNLLTPQVFEAGPVSILFGLPFGAGFERLESNGLVQTFAPHNWYVMLLIRTGIFGLAAWCVAVTYLILRARRLSAEGLFALVVLSTFGFFYLAPWQLGAWFGMWIAVSPKDGANNATRPGSPRRAFSGRASRPLSHARSGFQADQQAEATSIAGSPRRSGGASESRS
jgi:hypothetical protein